MAVFVNVLYKMCTEMVKIKPQRNEFAIKDVYRDVKHHFNITDAIQFKYTQNLSNICDDILCEYILRKYETPGWSLTALDDDTVKLLYESDSNQLMETTSSSKHYMDDNLPTKYELFEDASNSPTLQGFEINSIINAQFFECSTDIHIKILYALYKKHGVFSNNQQTKLAKLIIKAIFNCNTSTELQRKDFNYLAKTIGAIFKNEAKEIFYSAAHNGQKASGKLHDAYCNYRKELCSAGILRRRQYIRGTVDDPSRLNRDVGNININQNLQFVKTNTDENEEFCLKWKTCFDERRQLLHTQHLLIMDYINLFNIFKANTNFIFKLFLLDVEALHPKFIGIKPWNDMFNNVFKCLNLSRDVIVKKYLFCVEEADEHTRKCIAFLLLPYLFPARLVKSKTRTYKATKLECQEKFITYCETREQANLYEENFVDESQGLHPQIVFVGSLNNLTSYVKFL